MAPLAIALSKHIEQKGLHIVVQCLVIEEQFSQETEVLAVYLADVAINFEDGQVTFSVDLVCWWMIPCALGTVTLEQATAFEILQAKLAYVQLLQDSILLDMR